MDNRIETLVGKKARTLEEHLERAAVSGSIQGRYLPPESRKSSETIRRYVDRVLKESASFQFVRVASGKQSRYVAFGVPGPIIEKGGKFLMVPAQVVGGSWGIHYCLIYPNLPKILDDPSVFVRIDSGCLSGQVLGDLTCDCREQLEIAKAACVRRGSGIIINIPAHDGRGWGEFKLANQRIMDECSVDTIEAARLFYGDSGAIDQRTYTESVLILRALGFNRRHTFSIATGNPHKVGAFRAFGMKVSDTQAVIAKAPNRFVEKNLKAKLRHWRFGPLDHAAILKK